MFVASKGNSKVCTIFGRSGFPVSDRYVSVSLNVTWVNVEVSVSSTDES